MATDEREWTPEMQRAAKVYGQTLYESALGYGERLWLILDAAEVVPKSRVEAAEQRARELEKQIAEAESVDDEEAVVYNRMKASLEAAEAKLATAVEALRRAKSEMLAAGSDLRSVGSHQNAQMAYDAELRIARALSEIEQGDTK